MRCKQCGGELYQTEDGPVHEYDGKSECPQDDPDPELVHELEDATEDEENEDGM